MLLMLLFFIAWHGLACCSCSLSSAVLNTNSDDIYYIQILMMWPVFCTTQTIRNYRCGDCDDDYENNNKKKKGESKKMLDNNFFPFRSWYAARTHLSTNNYFYFQVSVEAFYKIYFDIRSIGRINSSKCISV